MSRLPLEVGVAASPLPGSPESGDRHVVCPFPGGVLVGVLDGLGHGTEAGEVSRLGCAILEEHTQDPLVSLFARCHERLRSTRGVVMSLASFRSEEGTMSWAGVGNTFGTLLRGNSGPAPSRVFLLQRAGVVGAQVPNFEAEILFVEPGDLLVLATDGIRRHVLETIKGDLPSQQIADQILRRHRKGTDDALVLVARYRGHAG